MEDQPYLQRFFLTCSQTSTSLYCYVSAAISIAAYNRNSFFCELPHSFIISSTATEEYY